MARRDEAELREAILDAARGVFLTEGFAAASVGTIARTGGVSTKTIYRFFETKTDILVAVISGFMEMMLPGLDEYVVERREELEPVLNRILNGLAPLGLSEGGLAANRLATTEVMRVPEMVAAFYREGHEKIVAALGRWLARQQDAGYIRLADPERAAAMLLSMAYADLTRRATISGEPPTSEAISLWIAEAVAIFLRGVAA